MQDLKSVRVPLMATILTLICVSSVPLKSVDNAADCQSPFVTISSGCYYFSDVSSNWYQSLKNCVGMSSDLVRFETVDEYSTVQSYLIENQSNNNWWIGATDDHEEGYFIWISTLDPIGFGNWSDGEPNNYEGENCVSLAVSDGFAWQDNSCDDGSRHYICRQ